MKKCSDCKWMRNPGEFAKCVAPQNIIKDRSSEQTGFSEVKEYIHYRYIFCSTHREGSFIDYIMPLGCSVYGFWWEPK